MTPNTIWNRATRLVGSLTAAGMMFGMVGCKDLDVANLNGASAEGLENAPSAQQLITAAQSLVTSWRSTDAGHASSLTRYGYEYWSYRQSEPRGLTGVVQEPQVGGFWGYGTVKNIDVMLAGLDKVTGMTDAEKAGIRGWLKMNLAIQYQDMQQAHDSFGIVLTLPADPLTEVPAIENKGTVWARIFTLMDQAYNTDLPAAGNTFVFKLGSGFNQATGTAAGTPNFNTPPGMRLVNRALMARWLNLVAVPIGRTGYNPADWAAVQTALAASFITPVAGSPAGALTAAQLRAGPFHTYEATSTNGLNSADRYSNTRIRVEAQCKALPAAGTCAADPTDANRDGRAYGANAKVRVVTPNAPLLGATSNLKQTDILAPVQTATIGTTASLPAIRNEELILIRAEAYYNQSDNANAITELNRIRTSTLVGLPALTAPYVADNALNQPTSLEDEILYEKRFSLWGETGQVWVDMRHYSKAHLIPHWDPTFRIFDIFPIPTQECEIRTYATKGCFQGGYVGIQNGPNLTFQPLQ